MQDNVLYKNAIKSMLEWQFAAFLLGALVLFGCVAFVALCISKKCGRKKMSRKYERISNDVIPGGTRVTRNGYSDRKKSFQEIESGEVSGSEEDEDGEVEMTGLL